MAVIREQRQFKVGPIGVARASEGGRIVGEAVSQSANQFANCFFVEQQAKLKRLALRLA
jgi:hypothetical protein